MTPSPEAHLHIKSSRIFLSKTIKTYIKKSAIDNLHLLAQRWERLLFTTGGALNLQKSCWHLMAWKWNNGKASLEIPKPTAGQLLLTEGYQTTKPITLPKLSPTESYKTLGVYISPSGSMKKAAMVLFSYSLDYASHVVGSTLTREETLISYLMVLLPRLSFPLPALKLTETQCNKIQSPALCVALPKLHMN